MSAKIKDLFPPTSSSIQLLARQRRGAAAAQNGNKTFDVVSQQDLEQIIFRNLVLIESHDKEFQELFLLILTKENMTDIQCSVVPVSGLFWLAGRGALSCVTMRDLETWTHLAADCHQSHCQLSSPAILATFLWTGQQCSGTSWVLPRQCFTLDVVTESQGSLILIIEPFPW